jgi:hypothetical protein
MGNITFNTQIKWPLIKQKTLAQGISVISFNEFSAYQKSKDLIYTMPEACNHAKQYSLLHYVEAVQYSPQPHSSRLI